MSAILRITRGVHDWDELNESIDLINQYTGLHVVAWTPSTGGYKSNELLGAMIDSPMADFAEPRIARWASIEETVTVNAAGFDQNHLAEILGDLETMLRDAATFWLNEWSDEIVYLTVKGKDETNPRYAVLYGGRISSAPDQYNQPFLQRDASSVSGEFTVELVRGHWMNLPPKQKACVSLMRNADLDDYETAIQFLPNELSSGQSLTTRIVAYWPLDETSGTTAAATIGGASMNGTYAGNYTLAGDRFTDAEPTVILDDTASGGYVHMTAGGLSTPWLSGTSYGGLKDVATVSFFFRNTGGWGNSHTITLWMAEECNADSTLRQYTRILLLPNATYTTDGIITLGWSRVHGGTAISFTAEVQNYITGANKDDWTSIVFAWDQRVITDRDSQIMRMYVNGVHVPGNLFAGDLAKQLPWQSGGDGDVGMYLGATVPVGGCPTPGTVLATQTGDFAMAHVILFDKLLDERELGYVINPRLYSEGESCEGAYVANHYIPADINYVYRYDASGPTWVNFSAQNVPFNIYPPGPAVGDIIYLGSVDNVFSSVHFSLDNGGGFTVTWEYWNGATWTALPDVADLTGNFTRNGLAAVIWNLPSNWVKNNPGMGTTAYWVRGRVTAIVNSGWLAVPQQVNEIVFTVDVPYFDTQETNIGGDITALAMIATRFVGPSTINKVIIGKRNLGRGENFNSYLNAGPNNLPAGVTFHVGNSTTITTNTSYPGRGYATFTPVATSTAFNPVLTWELGEVVTREYYGLYRALLSVEYVSGPQTGDVYYRLSYVTRLTERVNFPTVVPDPDSSGLLSSQYIDMGLFSMPPPGSDRVSIELQAVVNDISAGWSMNFVTLYLIPADEWIAEVEVGGKGMSSRDQITIDSTHFTSLHGRTRARISDFVYEGPARARALSDFGELSATGPLELSHNQQERFWLFFRNQPGIVPQKSVFAINSMNGVKRYLGLRGDR